MNLSRPQKLKIAFAATVIVAAGIEGTVLAQRHQVPAGRDAFLNYQVDSTDELVSVLKKNKTLRQRYAKHFGIPEDRVIAFVKEALVPYRVPRSCVVTDHGVTKDGRIYPVKVTLKKGTKVWATRSGLPILKWACANPVAKSMPGTLMASRPRWTKAPLGQPSMELASSVPSPILAPMPEAGVPSPEFATPETVAVDTSALTLPPALSGVGSTSVPAVSAAPLPGGGGSGGPGIAPFLIPVAIAVAANNNGGGGSSPTDNTIKTPTGPTDNTGISPVNGGTTNGGSVPTGDNSGTTNGGTTTGGTTSGGDNTGGTTTGGTNTGTTTGGTTTGGDNSGTTNSGTTNGGTTTGGDNSGTTNSGTTNGGTTNGGDNTGTTNGGTTNGGTTNTGETNSGSTNGGATNGGGDNTGTTNGGVNGGGSPTVPEPGTLALFAAGTAFPAFAAARRRFLKK
jgi:hypothetical protein